MTVELRRRGLSTASQGSVARAMRALGLAGARRGKPPRTTVPAAGGQRAADLLDRRFTAPAPNHAWVTDFTYVRTWVGFVYVAFIVDVFAQKIVAWHGALSKTVELVMTPLRMATWLRHREGHPVQPGQLIHHSDAGSQYTSIRFTEHLALSEIRPSIGSVGDAFDNALMESVIGLYKTECLHTGIFHDQPYRTLADVEYATAGWVDWWNHRRLHGTLGLVPPVEYEHAHYAALTEAGSTTLRFPPDRRGIGYTERRCQSTGRGTTGSSVRERSGSSTRQGSRSRRWPVTSG
jgi:transposase InsO family protein